FVYTSLVDSDDMTAQLILLGKRAIIAKFVGSRLSVEGIRNWCDTQWGSNLRIRFLER
ncbi:hypothetical protein KI387_000731, partial [Taxus chinensis]